MWPENTPLVEDSIKATATYLRPSLSTNTESACQVFQVPDFRNTRSLRKLDRPRTNL